LSTTGIQFIQGMKKSPQWEPTTNAAESDAAAGLLSVDEGVVFPPREKRDDTDIATAAERALHWAVCPLEAVTAKVQQGLITLRGQVTRNYERNAAECAVRSLAGVVGVNNLITLEPQTSTAFQRQFPTEATSAHGDKVRGRMTRPGHATSSQSFESAADSARM
jgi:osmotically-inducible protein OsmY